MRLPADLDPGLAHPALADQAELKVRERAMPSETLHPKGMSSVVLANWLSQPDRRPSSVFPHR